MSRPPRSERAGANSKGRPKRRAATNYLYKYQLAGDPSRIEEQAMKKALQESLEEHTSEPMATLVKSNQKPIKAGQRKDSSQKARAIINSSTNSSDDCKSSNSSSSTTNTSYDSRNLSTDNGGAITKRLRSNGALPVFTPPLKKHARLTTNGLSNTNSSNHKRCDKSDTSVLAGSPIPLFNGSIQRTYSRSQELQRYDVNPRSSTPTAATKKHTLSDHNESSKESLLSATTRTSETKPPVDPTRNTTTEYSAKSRGYPTASKARNQKSVTDNNKSVTEPAHKQSPPVPNESIKLKRESKNYAYAKMTALKVNTGRSYYLGCISKKNSDTAAQGPKNNPPFVHNLDLSSGGTRVGVNVTERRISRGSWSLLGVPEERTLYIRDDELPKRLICYPAIKHVEGDVIQVRDSVLLRSGIKQTDLPYIAKVCAFWEDAETGNVMMSLFWYYRPEHTEEGRKPHHLTEEIFASRHRDVDSVECIEDKCYVLTFNEYCRYRKRCKMEQVNTTWSLTDVTIPVSNESYPRRNRIPDSSVNPELVFCCRQIYDSRNRRLLRNHLISPKYGNI